MIRWRRFWSRGTIWALVVALAVACLGEGGYVSVGRQGGQIGADGATLSIAPDILSSPIQFRVGRADPAQLPPLDGPPGQIAQSDPFRFQSRGGEGMPATVSIPLKTPLPGEAPLEVYQLYEGEWVWLTSASALPEGNAVALIPALPATVVVVSSPPTRPQVSLRWSPQAPAPEGALRGASAVHPLDYQITLDGGVVARPSLLPPGGYRVIPVVQNGGLGGFDGALVAAILTDEEQRQRHIERLVALVAEGGYAGVELDYRGLDLSLREDYTAFVVDLAEALHGQGRLLYLDVPLPQRGDGGWNDGAYDWRQLGEVVDALVICPPKDLSFYSARIGEVLRYGINQVERRKLRLGINTSSHEKGPEGVRDISRSQALERAAQIKIESLQATKLISGEVVTLVAPLLTPEKDGSTGGQGRLAFSQEANALAFTYAVGGQRRSVWIENAQSLAYKLELAQRYRLGGVSLGGDFGGVSDARLWQVLASYRDKGQVEIVPGSETPLPLWQSSDGSLKERGQARVAWKLPSPGSYTVTLCLSDGAAQGCQELSLTVALPPPTPTPRPPATPTPTIAPLPAPPQASAPSVFSPPASIWGALTGPTLKRI